MFDDEPNPNRILVIAGEAADYPGLIAGLRAVDEGASFTLLVPGWPEAVGRAQRASARLRGAGLDVAETIVGDPDPFLAVGDVLHSRRFDEIVVADSRKLTRHSSADLYARV